MLIAEDEALIRMDLAEMLREEGYEIVGEAGDGQEAVELAESLKPDLVIMDVKMPRRDGIDAASEIAAKRIAPIVILTAFSQRELVERARDAGAMAYLVKPFTITDLIPAIEVAVSRFSEIAELEKEVAITVRPPRDAQAGRAREGFAAGQAGDDRTGGVQVDSAGRDGSAHHHEAGRRGGSGDARRTGRPAAPDARESGLYRHQPLRLRFRCRLLTGLPAGYAATRFPTSRTTATGWLWSSAKHRRPGRPRLVRPMPIKTLTRRWNVRGRVARKCICSR